MTRLPAPGVAAALALVACATGASALPPEPASAPAGAHMAAAPPPAAAAASAAAGGTAPGITPNESSKARSTSPRRAWRCSSPST